jgi:cytoskeletal protein CcmA (bactofilin family)
MRNNILSVGSKPISGEIGKVVAAGDVNIINADVEKLTGAGDITITNSYVLNTKIAGDITAVNSKFGTLRIAGEMVCKDNCKVDTLIVMGKLQADNLECKILRNFSKKMIKIYNDKVRKETSIILGKHWFFNFNHGAKGDIAKAEFGSDQEHNYESTLSTMGGSEFKGYIKADTFENLCAFEMNFEYDFKNIISTEPLQSSGVIECEKLFSFGLLNVDGINAETIYIHPTIDSKVNQLMGSNIIISGAFPTSIDFRGIPKSLDENEYFKASQGSVSKMQVNSIEGDIIQLDHVIAHTVSGDSVIIGDFCEIECVEYKNNIKISPNSIVKDIIKL